MYRAGLPAASTGLWWKLMSVCVPPSPNHCGKHQSFNKGNTMNDLLFLSGLGFILVHLLGWGFKHLPGERWQTLVVGTIKDGDDHWLGSNLTYYGFFIATSQLIALTLLLILLGAMGLSLPGTILAILLILACCIPAARLIAIRSRKSATPLLLGSLLCRHPASTMAIQFSSPYSTWVNPTTSHSRLGGYVHSLYPGRRAWQARLHQLWLLLWQTAQRVQQVLQSLFTRINFIFYGATKKVAYEGRLAGEKLIPIQAITCVLYTLGALIGSYLFLIGLFTPPVISPLP